MRINRRFSILLIAVLFSASIVLLARDNSPKATSYPLEMVVRSQFWNSIMGVKSSPEMLGVLLKINLSSAGDTRTFLFKESKRLSSPCFNTTVAECSTLKVLEALDSAKQIQASSQKTYAMKLSKSDALSLMLVRAFRADNARYKSVAIPYQIEEIELVYEKLGRLRNEEKTQS